MSAEGGIYDGRMIEIVALDGKANAQDSLLALKQAIDGDIRYVVSNISSVVHALTDAVTKHNLRNVDRRVLLINIDARDPRPSKCSFWHFRFNYHTDTEIDFLTSYLVQQPDVHKVYLINQDYAFGQAIQRASRELLARKRPDVQIVGDDLVPLGKVKDFAPYTTKIRASGADSVITGNWGNDMFLLIRASRDLGLDVRYYVLVGNIAGTTAGLGAAGDGRVWSLFPWHANAQPNPYESFNHEYKTKYDGVENFDYVPAHRAVGMLAQAFSTARSDDPLKIAYTLEGIAYGGPKDGRGFDEKTTSWLPRSRGLDQGRSTWGEVRCRGHRSRLEAGMPPRQRDAVPAIKCTMNRP